MTYLKTLYDKDVFPHKIFPEVDDWITRQTVKIILLNKDGKIALITNPIHNCFILPGGGIDEGEELYVAADRESQEEVRYTIDPIINLGSIEEYKARDGKRYETFGVIAKAKNEVSEDLRTEEEKTNGVTSGWYTIDEAEKLFHRQTDLLKEGKIDFYNIGFNIIRDYIFIKEAKRQGLL